MPGRRYCGNSLHMHIRWLNYAGSSYHWSTYLLSLTAVKIIYMFVTSTCACTVLAMNERFSLHDFALDASGYSASAQNQRNRVGMLLHDPQWPVTRHAYNVRGCEAYDFVDTWLSKLSCQNHTTETTSIKKFVWSNFSYEFMICMCFKRVLAHVLYVPSKRVSGKTTHIC